MMRRTALIVTLLLCASAVAAAPRHRHRAPRRVLAGAVVAAEPVGFAPAPVAAGGLLGLGGFGGGLGGGFPIVGAALGFGGPGRPIRPEAARYMGYPYNVPGYRYEGYDACLLRVGGPFGPGPSAGPCPFGLDRAF